MIPKRASKGAGSSDGKSTPQKRGLISAVLANRKRAFIALLALIVVTTGCVGLVMYNHSHKNDHKQIQTNSTLSAAEEFEQTKLPDDTSAQDRSRHYQIVASLYQQTDKKKALDYLLKAEKLTPTDKDLLYAIAKAYSGLGDTTNQALYEQKSGKKVDTQPYSPNKCDVSEKAC